MATIITLIILLFCNLSFAEPNHAGELGYCVLCNTVIMDRDGFHIKPNEEYNEIWFEFSNDSKGRIAFCDSHYQQIACEECRISEEIRNEIMSGIKRGWTREFVLNKWNKEKIDRYKQNFFSLEIVRRLNEEISNN